LEEQKRDDNIKMDLRDIGCEDGRWLKLIWDHAWRQVLVLTAMEPFGSATRESYNLRSPYL
jgi:hypothetical protein